MARFRRQFKKPPVRQLMLLKKAPSWGLGQRIANRIWAVGARNIGGQIGPPPEPRNPVLTIPLENTLAPSVGAVVSSSFVRVSDAEVPDFEGIWRTAGPNEARFANTRRVANELNQVANINTEDWQALGWTVTSATVTAERITATGNSASVAADLSVVPGFFRVTCDVRRVTGTGLIYFIVNGQFSFIETLLTTQYQRVSALVEATSAGTTSFGIGILASGDEIDATRIHVEYIPYAQTNQNPSEYVSVGLASAPYYQGSGVDGVQCFKTQNGNTVSADPGIVTSGSGAALPGPFYLMTEPTSTNNVQYSEDITNPYWGSTNITEELGVEPSPILGGLAYRMIETTANAVHNITNSAALPLNSDQWIELFLNPIGTRHCEVVLNAADFVDFDLTPGSPSVHLTGGTGVLEAYIFPATFGGGWSTALIKCNVPNTLFQIRILDDTFNNIYAGDNVSGLNIAGINIQPAASGLSARELSPIVTSGTTVTRTEDQIQYTVNLGNVPEMALTMESYVEAYTNTSGGYIKAWFGGATTNTRLALTSADNITNITHSSEHTINGIGVSLPVPPVDAGEVLRQAFTVRYTDETETAREIKMAANGTLNTGAPTPTDQIDFTNAPLFLGASHNFGLVGAWFLRDVNIYNIGLTDGELQAKT